MSKEEWDRLEITQRFPIVRMLKRLGVHFIIQAQKSIGIKKEIEENKDKEVIVVDYQINEEEAKSTFRKRRC